MAYTNVKFGMREGIGTDKNAYDWPLMRVEEMILIQAEGLAMSGQTTQALQVLNDFVRRNWLRREASGIVVADWEALERRARFRDEVAQRRVTRA